MTLLASLILQGLRGSRENTKVLLPKVSNPYQNILADTLKPTANASNMRRGLNRMDKDTYAAWHPSVNFH